MENIEQTKKKKKKLKNKLDQYDPRGVQTLFRTLLRNHYQLMRMIDAKASIMLTINSIIISLMMGIAYMAPDSNTSVVQVGAKLLLNFGMASMVFAVLAMLPHRYLKREEECNTGILYAPHFAKLSLEEYQTQMKSIISMGTSVYEEMINDLYHLGKSIKWKQRLIYTSVVLFLCGLLGMIVHTISHGVMIENLFIN